MVSDILQHFIPAFRSTWFGRLRSKDERWCTDIKNGICEEILHIGYCNTLSPLFGRRGLGVYGQKMSDGAPILKMVFVKMVNTMDNVDLLSLITLSACPIQYFGHLGLHKRFVKEIVK